MRKGRKMISNLTFENNESYFKYTDTERGTKCTAYWPLFMISAAWHKGCEFEDLADGFGLGNGTMGGDWSGIRDSSREATEKMLERALNFLKLK